MNETREDVDHGLKDAEVVFDLAGETTCIVKGKMNETHNLLYSMIWKSEGGPAQQHSYFTSHLHGEGVVTVDKCQQHGD